MNTLQAPQPLRRADRAPRHPLTEPAHVYAPPYDHPAADALAWHFAGHLRPDCTLRDAAVVLTPRDCFRADFLIEQPLDGHPEPLRIAVLCGPEDDDGGALAEPALHDALLVGTGAADVVYRFRPEDALRHPFDLLFLMAAWDPALFRGRARAEIVRRASPTVRSAEDVRPERATVRLSYPSDPVEVVAGQIPERPAAPASLVARRLSGRHPAVWTHDFERALRFYDLSGEDEARRWAKSA